MIKQCSLLSLTTRETCERHRSGRVKCGCRITWIRIPSWPTKPIDKINPIPIRNATLLRAMFVQHKHDTRDLSLCFANRSYIIGTNYCR